MTNAPDPHLEDVLREFLVEEALAASPPLEDVDRGLREAFDQTVAGLSGQRAPGAARGAALQRPDRGHHAYLRDGGRPRPLSRRHPLLTPAAGAAAAALVLLAVGAAVGLGGGAPEERGASGPGITAPAGTGQRAEYLGDEGIPSESLDVVTFTGSIDWSEVATEVDFYEVTVKTEGEKYLDDTGIIYRSKEYLIDSSWTCPPSLVLPPRFEIEVRAVGPDPASEPIWSRRFSAPPQGSPR